MHDENIYGHDPIGVIVRISNQAQKVFDDYNRHTIGQLQDELNKHPEMECFFQKLSEEEHKLIIPILGGQLEVVAKPHSSETYEAVVVKERKTIFRPTSTPPDTDFLRETIALKLIGLNERGRATDEFIRLYERVQELAVASQVDVAHQQKIWSKWIEAQQAIIEDLQKPYAVKGYRFLPESKDKKGNTLRYSLKFDLANEPLTEYKQLEGVFKRLGIEQTFDAEGNILLTRDEIATLDDIINREFADTIERSKQVGAILKLRPWTLAQTIARETGLPTSQNNHRNELWVMGKPNQSAQQIIKNHGLVLRRYRAKFVVLGWGNIMANEAVNQKHQVSFENDKNNETELGRVLPLPSGDYKNEFDIYRDDYVGIHVFGQNLARIYGKDNIRVRSVQTVYEVADPSQHKNSLFNDDSFTEDFWLNLRRALYKYKLEDSIEQHSNALYIEHTSQEELEKKWQAIEGLQLCNIAYSPLANDFRFKVKTQVIAKKTEQEIFLEKIKSLGGAEFVVEVPLDKGKTRGRKEQVYVGKLNSQASSLQAMVLSIPNIFRDDQKKAREALNFLMDESRPKISEIRANLKGDEVKVSWLKKAVDKVTDPRAKDKPVNERLGEFIFDASKARPIHDSQKLSEDSEYFWELKKNELLKLNEGQRKAVLAAIHCQDLALLQGPPGTGKTTVIAEMIWQMIRQNPQHKILLTSETNLAVDNALDRLLNTKGVNQDLVRYTTLIKPLRFGKMAKMDEEGAKYSAERIDTWASSVSSELPNEHIDELDEGREGDPEDNVEKNSPENNAVQDWMKRIATRAQHHNPKYAKVLKNWTQDLAMPSAEAKRLFRDKYFEYANVVGSTCTSTGSRGFSQGYQSVFNKTKGYRSNAQDKKNWLKIQFDTVIMDEASKATPPELLLPLCFAGRSIIIGDHRQLPPMLHEKDFKEALEAAGAHNLAEDIDREFTETSQFERLILNPQVSPEIISRCNIQYRMHPHINEVIKQFYIEEGGLEPAPELEQHANDADLGNIFSRYHGLYASGLVDAHTHTVWVDIKTPETREGTSVVNAGEVEAIRQVIEQLKNAKGFEEFQQHWGQTIQDEFKRKQAQEIGVISFYGAQKRLIKQSLKGMGVPLKINTVDRFQGMERNIVIVSTVRSEQQAGFGGKISPNRSPGFAKSPQRLNVALSRARRLLIVVGNKDFFSKVKDSSGKYLYRNAINAIKEYGRVVDFDNFVNQH